MLDHEQTEAGDRIRVFDLHCDTLDRLALRDCTAYPAFAEQNARQGIANDRLLSLKDNDAHVSLDRMREFSWCQCFAIFIPDGLDPNEAWGLFEQVQRYFQEQMQEHGEAVEQIRDAHMIEEVLAKDKAAALLTIEGGSFLEGSLSDGSLARIDAIAEAGVKMLTLTWNGRNALASGNDTDEGFSSFGREVVAALEDRRIVVDASHLNDQSFTDLLHCAERPFAASHSNARSVCGHKRNLTDYQFQAIAERGGIVGLNFCNDFLVEKHRDPLPEEVLRHIEHWLDLGGDQVLALGGDYDGADVPSWLDGCENLGLLYQQVAHAFGKGIADKLFFDNALDFFKRNESVC